MRFKNWIREEYENYDDKELLREAIKEEYYATNVYTQMAKKATNPEIRDILLHVAEEEKVHVEEFKRILERYDPEITSSKRHAEEELEEM